MTVPGTRYVTSTQIFWSTGSFRLLLIDDEGVANVVLSYCIMCHDSCDSGEYSSAVVRDEHSSLGLVRLGLTKASMVALDTPDSPESCARPSAVQHRQLTRHMMIGREEQTDVAVSTPPSRFVTRAANQPALARMRRRNDVHEAQHTPTTWYLPSRWK